MIILQESNPISLWTAFVLEGDEVVSLMLKEWVSSVPGVQKHEKFKRAVLYRRKGTFFSHVRFLLAPGSPLPQSANFKAIKSPLNEHGLIKRWIYQRFHRSFLVSLRKGVKAMNFKSPPGLKLVWTSSGKSVALYLNGEPWAFVHQEKNHGYSKGVLKPEVGNPWDQTLFEQTFLA